MAVEVVPAQFTHIASGVLPEFRLSEHESAMLPLPPEVLVVVVPPEVLVVVVPPEVLVVVVATVGEVIAGDDATVVPVRSPDPQPAKRTLKVNPATMVP